MVKGGEGEARAGQGFLSLDLCSEAANRQQCFTVIVEVRRNATTKMLGATLLACSFRWLPAPGPMTFSHRYWLYTECKVEGSA